MLVGLSHIKLLHFNALAENLSLGHIMQIVYVLISSNKDLFFEEFYISALSVRRHVPNAKIILLVDTKTKTSLSSRNHPIEGLVDKIVDIEIDDSKSEKWKSRYLKTSMAKYIEGDFLFIDTDTIICDNLEDIIFNDGQICAVLNGHEKINNTYISYYIKSRAKHVGFSTGYDGKHFNSGVILVRESSESKKFFELWHTLWLETCKKNILLDQVSFNEANNRMGGIIGEMDGVWNCQLDAGAKYITYAKIMHYKNFNAKDKNSNNNHFFELANDELLAQMKKSCTIPDVINRIIESPKRPESFVNARVITMYGDEYNILKSPLFSAFRYLYNRAPFVFNFFNIQSKVVREFYQFLFKRKI